ncbi:DUF4124 domain-containing protein [Dyella sp. 2HG41-7]|uniref:DUF4124 domain-containing protein n=1 Tax=Dyella sp. 2HG41-7 TaxID=2883239 RepID=UPI001F1DE4BF|nr:DUF4124 domain-containing protein [Dyella sp. 2HG41-7]
MIRLAICAVLILALLLVAALCAPSRAHAQTLTVYKCRTAQGQLIYQGAPCKQGQQQQTMQLDDSGPAASPLPESPNAPPAAAVAPPAPPSAPPTPPSTMYRCTRATDQTTYLSANGDPPPYYAPLAMTGIVPTPLGHITPGVKANAAMVASHYIQVQDQCVPMTLQDTCSTLRDQFDDNERKLSRAFKSDQPPLLQREKELLDQLKHC